MDFAYSLLNLEITMNSRLLDAEQTILKMCGFNYFVVLPKASLKSHTCFYWINIGRFYTRGALSVWANVVRLVMRLQL